MALGIQQLTATFRLGGGPLSPISTDIYIWNRDKIFVHTISSGLAGVVAYRESYALRGMWKTTIYPQCLTHNNLNELTISVSIFQPFFKLTLFN